MRRRISTTVCAVVLVAIASVGGAQKAGAVGPVPITGGGELTITFSSSVGLPLRGSFACTTMDVSGTGVMSLVGGDAHAYSGPVSLSGTYQTCGDFLSNVGSVVVNVSGQPAFGDLQCGSATQSDQGSLDFHAPVMFGGWAMWCEIGGEAAGGAPLLFAGVAAPTSIQSGSVDAFTVVGSGSV